MNLLSGLGLLFTLAGAARAHRERQEREASRRRGLSGTSFGRAGMHGIADDMGWTDPTGSIRGERYIEVGSDIDERVKLIREEIRRSSHSPVIRAAALDAVTRVCGDRWCTPEKDIGAEVKAIFDAMRDPTSPIAVRYVLDRYPSPIHEGGPVVGDQFSTAEATLRSHGGDCDDQTIVLGALLLSIGHPVKCRIVQTAGSPSWNHIYLLSSLTPNDPDSGWETRAEWNSAEGWIALDPTEPHPAGWQVDGADRVAATGRAAGIVLAVKDYPV